MAEQKPESTPTHLMYGGILPQEEMLEIGKRQRKLVIGVPREKQPVEHRISLTPEAVEVLVTNGHEVLIETKAGEGARYSDTDYSECGGLIVDTRNQAFSADLVLKVAPPDSEEIALLTGRQFLFSNLHLQSQHEENLRALMEKKITAIAYEQIKDEYNVNPILQSMNAISGNTAIVIAGEYLSNLNGGKGVMLGSIPGITPTEVIIIGAGTAAEYAVRAAMGFGAFVKVFDTSPQKLEQMQRNLNMRLHTSIFHPRVVMKALRSADVVIGAFNFYDGGPRYFITEEMVKEMKKGSVIVDISIDQGGCIETSEGRTNLDPVYFKHDVIHYCVRNLPSKVARTASIALSNILSPIMVEIGNSGGIKPYLKQNLGVRHGVYLYNGILTNERLGHRFNIPPKDIDLLMAAF